MFLKLKLKGSESKIEAPKNKNYGRPVHGPPLWTRFMDHPCGPRPWTPARGHGSSTIPVDLVHGPPLVDPVHGPPLWTWSMDPRSWTRCMEYFCGPPQMFEDEFCKRCKRISQTISGENYVNKLYSRLSLKGHLCKTDT